MTIPGKRSFPIHGWIGIILIIVFWILNWSLEGLRTHWGFFPLWLGYCLAIDALVYLRTGTSLLTRSKKLYFGLFILSAPSWWLFELMNIRTQYWEYLAREQFSDLAYFVFATISFSTVIPAVFGSAELIASYKWVQKMKDGPVVGKSKLSVILFFISGWVTLALVLLWPKYFFPFMWLSISFILDPINVWLGNKSLLNYTAKGDWRQLFALWTGSLICGFFWEMWNFYAYPKWIYHVPYVDFWFVFEMPLLGYLGYIPFAMELYAIYHFMSGFILPKDKEEYVLDEKAFYADSTGS